MVSATLPLCQLGVMQITVIALKILANHDKTTLLHDNIYSSISACNIYKIYTRNVYHLPS